jgi:hypothetical protein
VGPEDRQSPEFFISQYGRLRLEARHAGRERVEAIDPGPREELIETRRQNGDLFMGEVFTRQARAEQVAYIHCAPSKERVTATLVSGVASEAVAKVKLEVQGRPPVEVPTFGKKGFPFAFWVVAPLPPDARPLAYTSFDAAGQQIARGTGFAGYQGGCR